jgi:hypothetical protein
MKSFSAKRQYRARPGRIPTPTKVSGTGHFARSGARSGTTHDWLLAYSEIRSFSFEEVSNDATSLSALQSGVQLQWRFFGREKPVNHNRAPCENGYCFLVGKAIKAAGNWLWDVTFARATIL